MARKNKKKGLPKPKRLRMQANHTWTAPKGFKILVIDRGAVSFNIPRDWHLEKLEPVELYDKPQPDDNARLTVSFWRLPGGVDWSKLPLDELLLKSTEDADGNHDIIERGEVITVAREDVAIIWTRHKFIDPVEKREAYTLIAMGRGWNIHILATMDVWVEDLTKYQHVWDELLRSLQLGRYIEDPTRGEVLQ